MPDQTVGVTFDQNAQQQFTFDNDPVRMTAAGKIIFNRRGNASWTFVSAFVKNNSGQFAPTTNPGGQVMQINDAFTQMGTFPYTITVSQDGRQFTSPDPEIVNEQPVSGG